jgi:hypothetical protein
VHYFYDNKDGICNRGTYQVCSYYGAWYQVVQDKAMGEPILGEPTPEVHTYDCEDKTKSSQESSDEQADDPLDEEIRRSPVAISPTRAAMSMTMTTPAIMITTGQSGTLQPATRMTLR